MTSENKNLVATNRLRWCVQKEMLTGPKVLEQYFLDRSVLKEDGTPADGKWLPVPIEVVDE